MNGIEKEVDNLGRVVIPIKFRQQLGIKPNAKLLVSVEDGIIHISPAIRHCALYGKRVKKEQKLRLCDACIASVKAVDENSGTKME